MFTKDGAINVEGGGGGRGRIISSPHSRQNRLCGSPTLKKAYIAFSRAPLLIWAIHNFPVENGQCRSWQIGS